MKELVECIDHGCPEPVFDCKESGIMVEFRRSPSKTDIKSKAKMSPNVSPKMIPDATLEITKKILNLIKKDPTVTTAVMAEKVGVDKRTILRYLEQLKLAGKVERVGSARKDYWRVVEK